MKYTDQVIQATNAEFVNRVQQAVIEAALAISKEGATKKSHVDNQRLNLARQVLADARNWAQKFSFGICTFIRDAPSDKQISDAVTAVWDAYAGVNPNLVAEDIVVAAPEALLSMMPAEEPETPPEEPVLPSDEPEEIVSMPLDTPEEVAEAQAEAPEEVVKTPWYTKWFGIGG